MGPKASRRRESTKALPQRYTGLSFDYPQIPLTLAAGEAYLCSSSPPIARVRYILNQRSQLWVKHHERLPISPCIAATAVHTYTLFTEVSIQQLRAK